MKVVCDSCGAVYRVPDAKLVKPINKATCRQCGFKMLIPRPSPVDLDETLINQPDQPEAAAAAAAPEEEEEEVEEEEDAEKSENEKTMEAEAE